MRVSFLTRPLATLGLACLLGTVPAGCISTSATSSAPPTLVGDIDWWAPPPGMHVGAISAVAIGPGDEVWVLHRPRSLTVEEQDDAAPPVLRYASDGRFLAGYGGPGDGYDWPEVEHSLAVDAAGHFWISGSFRADPAIADDAILEFDEKGRFVKQIGGRGTSAGDADPANVRAASDIFVDDAAGEVFVADGYVNHRVVVFDRASGAFKRSWGAYGSVPPTPPDPPEDAATATDGGDADHFTGLHGIEIARDGTVYVADRGHQRVQLFTRQGEYLRQFRVDPGLESRLTASGLAFSQDRRQRYLYVSDWGNSRLLVFDRATLAELANIGGTGTAAGEMQGPHIIATADDGTLYVAEVQGRRVQRFRLAPR